MFLSDDLLEKGQMLSNTYFLAKFRFDTAENEPAKNFANFATCFVKFANLNGNFATFADLY